MTAATWFFAGRSSTPRCTDSATTTYRSATTSALCGYRSAGRYHVQPCSA
ncbi:hypothetical protein K7G98_12915 [Saccharothrix sp. MB29]|nr:hypothetical protein [Saccharothrix sp. MB29]